MAAPWVPALTPAPFAWASPRSRKNKTCRLGIPYTKEGTKKQTCKANTDERHHPREVCARAVACFGLAACFGSLAITRQTQVIGFAQ